jgi:flavin reductase (DIM6/NTAB) family NADH-FMN oxidoreductase RutF
MIVDIQKLPVPEKYSWLQHAIVPRPIAFASTIDKQGNVNLSPFSFFNLFSNNPPIVIFSPIRSGRTGELKHTVLNILEVPEVVIHLCDYNMVQQMSLSSCEYPRGIDEFDKAGFTKEAATLVKPPLVKEAKIKLECRVNEVKSLGENGGAGQLVIAEVLLMHVDDSILNAEGSMIEQTKMHHVARLGGDYYCVINESNLFKVAKPLRELGIGIDALPASIRNSSVLTGNHLGQLANVQQLPELDKMLVDEELDDMVKRSENDMALHRYAAVLLDSGDVQKAWQVLLRTADENE